MTIWEAMNTSFRTVIFISVTLCLLSQLYFFLFFLGLRKKKVMIICSFALLLICAVLFFVLYDGLFHYEDDAYPRTWPAVVSSFCSLPAVVLLIIGLIFAGCLIVEFAEMRRVRKAQLSPMAIKETIDLLPVGVAFAGEDGNVALSNLTMNELALSLTGNVLSDIRLLQKETGLEGEVNDIRKQSAICSDAGRSWQITSGQITEGEKLYRLLTATDITAEVQLNEKLKATNRKLTEINRRLEIYNRTAEELVISQELLNARMQIHNETGHVLLACRHYLDHPGQMDEVSLLKMLKLTNAHLLKEYEDDDTEKDPLVDAIRMAGLIGVTVSMSGVIPEEEDSRKLIAAAISECATNIKKHSDGNVLFVVTEKKNDSFTFSLSGESSVGDAQIEESGGLASLHRLVDRAGGSMEVTNTDAFTVKILL